MSDQTSATPLPNRLFDQEGSLCNEAFSPAAWELMLDLVDWLGEISRRTILPLDLLVVMLQRGNSKIAEAIRSNIAAAEGKREQLLALELLARQIDREDGGQPLHRECFSIGMLGILNEAGERAQGVGRSQIDVTDLEQALRLRMEFQESVSLKWAMRQLSRPRDGKLFDLEGELRPSTFSKQSWTALTRAAEFSAHAGLPFVGTPQLVAAFCVEPGTILHETSRDAGVGASRLCDELLRIVGARNVAIPVFDLSRRTLTPRVIRLLHEALDLATQNDRAVEEVDILSEFVADGGSSLELIRALGIEPILKSRLRSELSIGRSKKQRARSADSPAVDSAEETSVLEQLGTNISQRIRDGHAAQVLGRDDELRRVISVLLRTEQRNPLLTGEPGVGKTALATALAREIEHNRVPRDLRGCDVIELHTASLLGGTSFRGELEARISSLVQEASTRRCILFIDEAHAVLAPSSGSGRPAETPNHLKAALASGDIAVVAATTEAEYRRWIEEDPALSRRFERIAVRELPTVTTRRVLCGLASDYTERWKVNVPDEAIDASIELSTRFIVQRSQPDKAKKLLMDAAIATRLNAEDGNNGTTSDDEGSPVVTRSAVAQQVAFRTGIPLSRILGDGPEWWAGLGRGLSGRLTGQADTANELSRALFKQRFEPGAEERSLGRLSVVAQHREALVQIAEAVAAECFGSSDRCLALEMRDYREQHSLSRLIGAPPGYVGYADEDHLVAPLRRDPAQVVLLIDFPDANPAVRERLERLCQQSSIRDTRGKEADIRHAIIIYGFISERADASIGFGPGVRRSTSTAEVRDILARLEAAGVATIHASSSAPDAERRRELVAGAVSRFMHVAGISDEDTRARLLRAGLDLAEDDTHDATAQEFERRLYRRVLSPELDHVFRGFDNRRDIASRQKSESIEPLK